jgi:hypothetical protein
MLVDPQSFERDQPNKFRLKTMANLGKLAKNPVYMICLFIVTN